jgi:hypothetical protein
MILYAGTQDGMIWASTDGGDSWTDVTDGTPGFYVTSIVCSTINPFGVIATFSGYRDNDHVPYIYRSEYAGLNWQPLESDLPMLGVNALFILPGTNDGILFAGTDGGVYISVDAGVIWERVGTQMPYMPVYDLDYNPVKNTLIAATFSRGIMTFPLDELDVISSDISEGSGKDKVELKIYPTITSGTLYIERYPSKEFTSSNSLWITDIHGRIVHKMMLENYADREMVQLPAQLHRGIYFVHLSGAVPSKAHKVILM